MSEETFTVVLSPAAFAVLCGLVQPTDEVDSDAIYTTTPGLWEELHRVFPIEGFWQAVQNGAIEYADDDGDYSPWFTVGQLVKYRPTGARMRVVEEENKPSDHLVKLQYMDGDRMGNMIWCPSYEVDSGEE